MDGWINTDHILNLTFVRLLSSSSRTPYPNLSHLILFSTKKNPKQTKNPCCWQRGLWFTHQKPSWIFDKCFVFWLIKVFLRLILGPGDRKVFQLHAPKERLQPAESTGDTTNWRNNFSSWCPATAMLWIPSVKCNDNDIFGTHNTGQGLRGQKWSHSHAFNPLLTSRKANAGFMSE